MSKSELFKRYGVFLIGLLLSAIGIGFITSSGTGTSSISSVPYVLSKAFSVTLGTFTFIFNVLMIAAQKMILRKDFKRIQYLQILASMLFGFCIDISMLALSVFNPDHYYEKIIFLLAGCLLLGFGVYLQVLANVLMNAGEGLIKAIATKARKEFGIVKVIVDSSMVLIAIILSLSIFGRIIGVREGTVISALLVGLISKMFGSVLRPLNLEKYLFSKDDVQTRKAG